MKKLLGYFLLFLILGGFFAATAISYGLLNALIVWAAAILTAAIVFGAVYLIVS